ncbi:MAG: hypothetical protein WC453_02155 [Patescibacteria group bacterium]
METTTQHQSYQEVYFKIYRRATKLPDSADLAEIISALVDMEQCQEAAEMLFGCEASNLVANQMDYSIFQSFCYDETSGELIKKIAHKHAWSDDPLAKKGLAIQVYPGEFLIIPEPLDSEVLTMVS